MSKRLKYCSALIIVFLISSCTSIAQKKPNNKPVRLIQKNEIFIVDHKKQHDCEYLGEIIASEGHWYTYWFVSNRQLTQGALNDMYNNANKIGANVVYISDNIPFITSVTFYGQAYFCKFDNTP